MIMFIHSGKPYQPDNTDMLKLVSRMLPDTYGDACGYNTFARYDMHNCVCNMPVVVMRVMTAFLQDSHVLVRTCMHV